MATSIYLNIYDLTPLNKYLDCLGIGAYHSAVQIFDTEFSFGAHPYNFSGVIESQPNTNKLLQLRKTILIGQTTMKLNEINKVLNEVKKKFNGNTYDVFKNNCNHFANELCMKLLNKKIPRHINRLSNFSSIFRCLFSSKLIYGDALQSKSKKSNSNENKMNISGNLEAQTMLERDSQILVSTKIENQKSESGGENNNVSNNEFGKHKNFFNESSSNNASI